MSWQVNKGFLSVCMEPAFVVITEPFHLFRLGACSKTTGRTMKVGAAIRKLHSVLSVHFKHWILTTFTSQLILFGQRGAAVLQKERLHRDNSVCLATSRAKMWNSWRTFSWSCFSHKTTNISALQHSYRHMTPIPAMSWATYFQIYIGNCIPYMWFSFHDLILNLLGLWQKQDVSNFGLDFPHWRIYINHLSITVTEENVCLQYMTRYDKKIKTDQ